jgi:hypothetical protein
MMHIEQLHNQAMDLAENAFLAQQKGDSNTFVQLSRFEETTALLKTTRSKLDVFKSKLAALDGGKEILREIEWRFAL